MREEKSMAFYGLLIWLVLLDVVYGFMVFFGVLPFSWLVATAPIWLPTSVVLAVLISIFATRR